MSLNYLHSFVSAGSLVHHYDTNEKFIVAAWDAETHRQPKFWSRRSLLPLDMDEVLF